MLGLFVQKWGLEFRVLGFHGDFEDLVFFVVCGGWL